MWRRWYKYEGLWAPEIERNEEKLICLGLRRRRERRESLRSLEKRKLKLLKATERQRENTEEGEEVLSAEENALSVPNGRSGSFCVMDCVQWLLIRSWEMSTNEAEAEKLFLKKLRESYQRKSLSRPTKMSDSVERRRELNPVCEAYERKLLKRREKSFYLWREMTNQ